MLHLGTADPVTRRRTLTRPQVEFGGRVRTGELHGQKEKSDAGRLEYNSTKVRARSVDEQSSGVWVARRSRGRGAGVVCLAESPVPQCATVCHTTSRYPLVLPPTEHASGSCKT